MKQTNQQLVVQSYSFSLQEAVAGVSGEESLVAVQLTSNKKAIWN
jgi:hypothetical protein